jgi:hypothetical protein
MTNQQHPITPPTELVEQWLCSDDYLWGPLEQTSMTITANRLQNVATQAAQWGADQELEACCEWLCEDYMPSTSNRLRTTRRPKPPSLKEQALAELDRIPTHDNEGRTWGVDVFIIRRALEALDD